MNPITKFKRGQIWWVSHSGPDRTVYSTDKKVVHNSVTNKDRPYLIVSCDISNEHSTIINCVPISTREPDEYPMHVHYKDPDGRPQQVQCEQVCTKSQGDFRNYMYCLTDDLMKRVNVALSHQLGLATGVDTIGELLEYVDNMIQRKIEVLKNKEKEHTTRIVSETALHIRSSLSEMMRESIKEATTVSETITIVEKPQVTPTITEEKEETSTESSKPTAPIALQVTNSDPEVETIKLERTQSGRIRWTDKAMKMFCDDYDKLPVDTVVAKYGLKNRATAVNYRSLFRSKLK